MKMVLAARFLGGISGGAFLVIAPIFISEVAEDSIRGTLASGKVSIFIPFYFKTEMTHHNINLKITEFRDFFYYYFLVIS